MMDILSNPKVPEHCSERVLAVSLVVSGMAFAGCAASSPAVPPDPPETTTATGADDSARPSRRLFGVARLTGLPPKMRVPRRFKESHGCEDKAVVHNAVVSKDGKLADVIISLQGDLPPPADMPPPATVYAKDCMSYPRVLTMVLEQPLHIFNRDSTMHNVHAKLDGDYLFNFAQPSGAPMHSKTFSKTGMVALKDDIHSWEKTFIYVAKHSFATTTDEAGEFSLSDVPNGRYRLEAWHSQFGRLSHKVVMSGEAVRVDFDYRTSMSPPKENPNELENLF